MSKWLLRGIVFAALMVIVRLLQGAMIGAWEKQSLIISVTLVVLYIVAAFVWGVLDGQSDAKAQPDPDRREDLAMAWLVGYRRKLSVRFIRKYITLRTSPKITIRTKSMILVLSS